MLHFFWWSYFLILISSKFIASDVNVAPAKVTLRLQVSKLPPAWNNESRLRLCVDKQKESCFWTLNEEIMFNGELYKEIAYTFFIDNMATELIVDIIIENSNKKMDFPKKSVNLVNLSSKSSFSIDSFNLDSLITVTIEHQCEDGYYPPRQCTKVCYPMPNESVCDGFGNKKCHEGLLYNAKVDRCIANNCIKSNIKCQNGRCVNDALTFKCECLDNYFGKFCQFRNHCNPNPCSNGGRCKAGFNNQSFTCSCTAQYSDDRCLTRVTKKCPCPQNLRCNYSKNDILESCTPEIFPNQKDVYVATVDSQVKDKLKAGGLESKKYNEWIEVSMTTTIIVVVGCLMIILIIGISVYIFCLTRERKTVRRDYRTDKSPSTLYTDFTPKLNETSFRRSFSLDDNSAYMPAGSQVLQILPNNLTIGSSTAYSLHSNSYQENLPSGIRNYPVQCSNFMYQKEYPITPLILHQGYTRGSSISTTSCSSLPTPPVLPPRPIITEITSPDTVHELE